MADVENGNPNPTPANAGTGGGNGGPHNASLNNPDEGAAIVSVADITKLFAPIDKLSKQSDWAMWSFRTKTALALVSPDWAKPKETNPLPDNVQHVLFHTVTSRIDNDVMVHYLNVANVGELIDGLSNRFDPQTSTTEANEVHALFHLQKPVHQMDKLLDEAERLHARIIAKNISFSPEVYYHAIVGIVPPQYYHVRSAYEARVTAQAKEGEVVKFDPNVLILELRNEFTNWRATHPYKPKSASASKKDDKKDKGNYKGGSETRTAHANAATPYPKSRPTGMQKKKLTCFNCNREGHTTQHCNKPWTQKSEEAMKKKGITKKASSSSAVACASTSLLTLLNAKPQTEIALASTSAAQTEGVSNSDWLASVSGGDVQMSDASVSIDYSFPVFTALNSPNILHLIDTGATIHCTPYMSRLFNVHAAPPLNIMVANSTVMTAKLKGDLALNLVGEDGKVSSLILNDVYYCANMPFTLISVSLLHSYHFHFNSGHCTIADSTQQTLISIPERHHLYYVEECYANVAQTSISLFELHKRTGHMSYTYLKKLLKSSSEILTLKINDFTEKQCEDCITNNIHRTNIPKRRTSSLAAEFGDHFHIDIFGPLRTAAIGGYQYWLTIVDDATRWTTIAPLRHKSDALTAWVNFSTELFTQYGIKVKLLQSDNDAVFTSAEFTRYLQSQGTKPRLTVHDTPQQNGVAERTHQTLMNHVRVNLHSAGLPDKLWNYAVQYAAFCLNRSPRAAIDFKTPYFMRNKTHYNIDSLHAFGARCIYYDEAQSNKLNPRGQRALWIGFAEHAKGHLLWTGTKVTTERNVQFLDSTSQIEGETQIQNNQNQNSSDESMDVDTDTLPIDNPMDIDEELQPQDTLTRQEKRQSKRQKTLTRRARGLDYDEVEPNLASFLTEFNAYYSEDIGDPVTFNDVLKHPLKDKWIDSMREEISTLERLGTWSYADPPADANIIGTRFVYKTKEELGQKKRMKSRLVVQGYAQKEGLDFWQNDLFAPVARHSSTHSLLAWAATNDYEIMQIDIKSAYLYGELNDDEEIYIRPPPGDLLPNLPKGKVLKLRKALYGLKQAGRRWYKTFSNILTSLKLLRSTFDNAVFYRRERSELQLALSIHVDDVILIVKNYAIANAFKLALGKHVAFTDGGDLHWFLGIEIQRDRKNKLLKMRQKHYIESIVKRYGFDKEHSRRAPMLNGQILVPLTSQSEQDKEFMKTIPYMSLVGSLRYVADCTRPDIAYCTGQLARYLHEPSITHYWAAKHCYQYLKGTADHWLTLGGTEPTQLVGYSDADGMTTSGNKPIMGYVFKLGQSLISWSSKRATIVTLSVTEAELCALAHASTEAIYLKNFVNEVLQTSFDPTTIYTDSKSTLHIISAPEEQHTQRTKHFDIRKNFVSNRIELKFITVEFVTTNEQQADLLTKSLSADTTKRFMQLLRITA